VRRGAQLLSAYFQLTRQKARTSRAACAHHGFERLQPFERLEWIIILIGRATRVVH
jgi:hypothetical protein